jgi:6-phosphogluconolactonase
MNAQIEVLPDAAALGRRACQIFFIRAGEAINERGLFRVAISGGRSPVTFFASLADDAQSRRVDWRKVQLFWVDERCVPPDSLESNYRLASEMFLRRISVPDESVFRIRGEMPDREAEARRYEAVIGRAFGLETAMKRPRFDLMVMGMGRDGHVASLFPGSAVLNERRYLVRHVETEGARVARITMTPPLILAARSLVMLVTGADKAAVLRDVLTQPLEPQRLPAQILCAARERTTWLVDGEAGRLLSTSSPV